MMESIRLVLLDQIRSNLCILTAYFLFCWKVFPERKHFKVRVPVGLGINIAFCLLWGPVYRSLITAFDRFVWIGYLYYLLNAMLMVAFIPFCFEISLGQTMFRCFGGSAVNVIPNVILRYILVHSIVPTLPAEKHILYVLLWLGVYTLCYGATYYLLIRKIRTESAAGLDRGNGGIGLFLFILFNLSIAAIQTILENVITPMLDGAAEPQTLLLIRYFTVFVMLAYAVLVLFLLYFIYGKLILKQEQAVVQQLIREKKHQYEFTKESIDLINMKAHDLKHQLAALEAASDQERMELIDEVRHTVERYDRMFHTGNEVLDIILMEKDLMCQKRGIRMSCVASAENLDRIRVVDLYTLLGNALDNAIETVSKIQDSDKKIITIRVENFRSLLHFDIENYYDGEVAFQEDIPRTSKDDNLNHGFGIKSMRLIARQYGGDIRITAKDGRFLLQILLAP